MKYDDLSRLAREMLGMHSLPRSLEHKLDRISQLMRIGGEDSAAAFIVALLVAEWEHGGAE